MSLSEASKLSKQEVYDLLKGKGHTNFSANEVAELHDKGADFSFLF
jgi:hypothetical protein